jgi:hypothetical protein
MWIDYKKYTHYQLVENLLPIMKEDLDNYLSLNKTTHVDAREAERIRLNMGANEAANWYMLPVIRNRISTEWAYELPKTSSLAKEIPGLVNITLNFFAPGYGAPAHSDYDYDMREDITNNSKCYAILLGVRVPSNDIKLNGFRLGSELIAIKEDDIFGFDGGIEHESWNNTLCWRYTCNIDIDQTFWKLKA